MDTKLDAAITKHRRAYDALSAYSATVATRWTVPEAMQSRLDKLVENERRAARALLSYRPITLADAQAFASYVASTDAGLTDDDKLTALKAIGMTAATPPRAEKVSYTVPEAATLLSLSKDYVWKLVASRAVASVKVGKRRLILADTLTALVRL